MTEVDQDHVEQDVEPAEARCRKLRTGGCTQCGNLSDGISVVGRHRPSLFGAYSIRL
ncbi:MAG TPA: hypothetical protein VGU70_05750 [Methylobacterium sp.]|uniref:hypothetical protein n=1 Tax=Methylorubrum sp. B1-46 TaxID=2897334 RepID=UPI001E3ACA4F|nr:hypothetical protein [Methylorubrum sp. B1-46]UGB25207.1 hypothetical protein LPC10_20270 [Methylorubrum sp. B1-46]HEV2542248.1 hypothetical protein [Methylobacterium sp.]